MAKFTKLNIGDSVASSGGRVWKKLSAESAEDNSIVGTWTFNASQHFNSDVSIGVISGTIGDVIGLSGTGTTFSNRKFYGMSTRNNGNQGLYIRISSGISKVSGGSSFGSYYDDFKTVTFNEYAESIATDEFKVWLKENATKTA